MVRATVAAKPLPRDYTGIVPDDTSVAVGFALVYTQRWILLASGWGPLVQCSVEC